MASKLDYIDLIGILKIDYHAKMSVRRSKKGNYVIHASWIQGCDDYPGSGCGYAYIYEGWYVVTPKGDVVERNQILIDEYSY